MIITGTPGTGKTTVASFLSRKTGIPFYTDSFFAKNKTVDLRAFRLKVLHFLKKKKELILEGHLFCEIKLPVKRVVVLRAHPEELMKRLGERGYPRRKILENVLAEALDYCLLKAESKYENVIQIDTTKKNPEEVVKSILSWEGDAVDWSPWLEKSIYMRKLNF